MIGLLTHGTASTTRRRRPTAPRPRRRSGHVSAPTIGPTRLAAAGEPTTRPRPVAARTIRQATTAAVRPRLATARTTRRATTTAVTAATTAKATRRLAVGDAGHTVPGIAVDVATRTTPSPRSPQHPRRPEVRGASPRGRATAAPGGGRTSRAPRPRAARRRRNGRSL